jgi:AraC-like DNA-binding protein
MRITRLLAPLGAATRSVRSAWLLSYLLLLLLPIALSVVVYFMGQGAIEREIGRLHGAVLDQIRIAGDAALQDVRRTAYQTGVNNNLRVLINRDISYRDVDPYTLVALYGELGRIKLFSEYSEEIIIYIRNIDRILTLSGLAEPKQYYELAYHGVMNIQDSDYRAWHEALRNRHTEECVPILRHYEGNELRQKVIYMQSLPLDRTTPVDATIVITVSKSRFERILQNIQSINDSEAMIVDGENRLLFTTIGPYDRSSPLESSASRGASGTTRISMDGKSVVASFVGSRVSDWKYVSLIPESSFTERIGPVRTASLAGLGLCVLLGGAAAFIFARRNYDPVARLIGLLEHPAGAHPHVPEQYNEYRFLQDAMGTVLDQNEDYKQQLQRQNTALRKNFLSRLLTGAAFHEEGYVDNALATFGIRFESECFAVLMFYISDSARPAQAKNGAPGAGLPASRLMVAQIVEEAAKGNLPGQVTEVDGMIASLLNVREGRVSEARQDTLRLAREVRQRVQDRLGLELLISTSAIHQTLAGIPAAYREALSVMEYKVAMEDDEILSYEEIPKSASEYNYSIAEEQHLMNHVKAGDDEAAAAVIEAVFENRFVRTSMSIDLIKCLVFDVLGTILKTLPETTAGPDALFVQGLHVFDRLAGCVTVQEMKQTIKEIVKTVCAYVRQHRTSRRDQLASSIMAVARERLGDFNLSVSSIADQLRLSPAHVTKVFRDQTGQGLFEYISELRMETAKHLLGNQEMDIKDVAARVGYLHSSVFIRAFKKHEGVTPGQYRQALRAST